MQPQKRKSQVPRADWSGPAPLNALSPLQAKARLKLVLQAEEGVKRHVFGFSVQHDHAPAFKSLVDELAALLASRLGGKNTPQQEQAMTQAAVALGELRKAVSAQVAEGDPNYKHAHE